MESQNDKIHHTTSVTSTQDWIKNKTRFTSYQKSQLRRQKKTDKNMGIIAIRDDIYNGLTRKWLKEPSSIHVNRFPHNYIFHRLVNIVITHNLLKHIGDKWISNSDAHKTPNIFNCIPKIHEKTLWSCPRAETHSYCLTKTLSAVAQYLPVNVNKYPSITQDSRQVIRQLEEITVTQHFVILTYDVQVCYPNMNIYMRFNLYLNTTIRVEINIMDQIITTYKVQQLRHIWWQYIQVNCEHSNWKSSSATDS